MNASTNGPPPPPLPPPHHHQHQTQPSGSSAPSTPNPTTTVPSNTSTSTNSTGSSASSSINRSQRCGVCRGCQCKPCGLCTYCQDSPQFGGPGVKKQSCIERRCLRVLENRLHVSKNFVFTKFKFWLKNFCKFFDFFSFFFFWFCSSSFLSTKIDS